MSQHYIPEHLDPFRYADQGLGLHGSVKIVDMKRLGGSTSLVSGDLVTVDLQFGTDEQGITFLKGQIETKLNLQCQRCMEPFTYEIMSHFILGIVDTLDEANALPDHYEPALAQDGMLALRDLIEDEIILNLPIIPRHESDQCQIKLPQTDLEWGQGEGENPFHVLKSLKRNRKAKS